MNKKVAYGLLAGALATPARALLDHDRAGRALGQSPVGLARAPAGEAVRATGR
jgi:hypothetical protein